MAFLKKSRKGAEDAQAEKKGLYPVLFVIDTLN